MNIQEILDKHKKWLSGTDGGERADLRGANLLIFQGTQHTAYATPGTIQIGCERHSIQHWLENYEVIGKQHRYSDAEISLYLRFIQQTKEYFEKILP